MDHALPDQIIHGRGAIGAPVGRFEAFARQAVDDGWWRADEPARLRTRLHADTAKSVINDVDSPDLGLMRSINPYRGCEHGCIYCFARPSHAYLGFSPGLDFETEIFHKPDAVACLTRELAAKNYQVRTITLGSNTDCYQPVERELCLTRGLIAVLQKARHPFAIITKSALVLRDLDLLRDMAADNLVRVNVSLTTLDPDLARRMEPRAAAPYKRLKTIETLAKAGVPVNVMVAPVIPGLNDSEMEALLRAARDAGASDAHYTLVRLPYELKQMLEDWLRAHYPDRAERVLSLIRQTHNGKLYDATFGKRRTGEGPYAQMIADRFALARRAYGYPGFREKLRTDLFTPPGATAQLGFGF